MTHVIQGRRKSMHHVHVRVPQISKTSNTPAKNRFRAFRNYPQAIVDHRTIDIFFVRECVPVSYPWASKNPRIVCTPAGRVNWRIE